MEAAARLLNQMVDAGVIDNYAVFGAVAQMRYTEAVVTLDADVLVAVPDPDTLNVLGPIYAFCRDHGFKPEGEAIRVGDWPVQFIPTFSELTKAAVEAAEIGEIGGVPLRVVRADYLAVIALDVGRAKDLTRVLALRETGAVHDAEIADLAKEFDLSPKWEEFLKRFDET